MAANIMEQLQNPKNWKRTHKKSYEVYVCRPLPGTQCSNKLEGTNYITDRDKQFIISGTVAETWVIDVNKLAKTYVFADGTPITTESLTKKIDSTGQMDWQKMKTRADNQSNFAIHLPLSVKNFPVQTSWGDTLLANRTGVGHGKGDFLVCSDNGNGQPNINDVWVVNGEIFPMTYDLRAFPNMYTANQLMTETARPTRSFVNKQLMQNTVEAKLPEIKKRLREIFNQVKGKYGFTRMELTENTNENVALRIDVYTQAGYDRPQLFADLLHSKKVMACANCCPDGQDYQVITNLESLMASKDGLFNWWANKIGTVGGKASSTSSTSNSTEKNGSIVKSALNKVSGKLNLLINDYIDEDEWYFHITNMTNSGGKLATMECTGNNGSQFSVNFIDANHNPVGQGKKGIYNVSPTDIKQAILEINSYLTK